MTRRDALCAPRRQNRHRRSGAAGAEPAGGPSPKERPYSTAGKPASRGSPRTLRAGSIPAEGLLTMGRELERRIRDARREHLRGLRIGDADSVAWARAELIRLWTLVRQRMKRVSRGPDSR
jgi:hypothetical protein